MESVVFFIFQYETVVLVVPFRNHPAENPEEMLVGKKKGEKKKRARDDVSRRKG